MTRGFAEIASSLDRIPSTLYNNELSGGVSVLDVDLLTRKPHGRGWAIGSVRCRCSTKRMITRQGGALMFGWFTKFLNTARGARKQLGNKGEVEAALFLERLGYKILHRQFRGRFGELDLVALDGDTIVFVEVKTRASTAAGHPTESITLAKQTKITRSALAFLKQQRWLHQRARFDVIAIVWSGGEEPPQIQHYINAFEPVGFGQMFS